MADNLFCHTAEHPGNFSSPMWGHGDEVYLLLFRIGSDCLVWHNLLIDPNDLYTLFLQGGGRFFQGTF